MNNNQLLKEIQELEIQLHQPDVRTNPKQLESLLHKSFVEFGRSGKRYVKEEIVARLPTEEPPASIWTQDFSIEIISDDVVLLTYKSAQKQESGELTRHTNRSSLWQHTKKGWQLRFHQGTATDEFEKNAT